jgi:hypothetical protein
MIIRATPVFFTAIVLAACSSGGDGNSPQKNLPTKSWDEPVKVSQEILDGGLQDVSLAMDRYGRVTAVWAQYFFYDADPFDAEEGRFVYQVATSQLSGYGWSMPELINDDGAASISDLQFKFDEDGRAVAIWSEVMPGPDPDSEQELLKVKQYAPNGGWGVAETLYETSFSSEDDLSMKPKLAVAPSGNAVAVWEDWTNRSVLTSLYSPMDGWAAPETIPSSVGNVFTPSGADVAINDSAKSIAVWTETNSGLDAMASHYDGTTWSTPAKRLKGMQNMVYADNPRVGLDSSGNGVAVWQSYDDEKIYYNLYTPDGGWSQPSPVPLSSPALPEFAMNANGDAVVIWIGGGVSASVFSPASGWSQPVTITGGAGIIEDMRVAINDSGDAIAIWTQTSGAKETIWSNHYNTGSGWSTAQVVTSSNRNLDKPQIVFDNDNTAVAVWIESGEIWASSYK